MRLPYPQNTRLMYEMKLFRDFLRLGHFLNIYDLDYHEFLSLMSYVVLNDLDAKPPKGSKRLTLCVEA